MDWLGAYVQAEKSTTAGSLYGMAGWAQNSYTFVDFFRHDAASGGYRTLESGNIGGYQIKGGAVRNLNDQWSIFGNAGVISKVPIFDGVIDDNNGTLNADPKNEKFLSYEVGTQFRSNDRQVSLDVNLYHTTWRNRTLTRFVQNIGGVEGVDGLVNLLGVDARHMGVEAEGAYQPSNVLALRLVRLGRKLEVPGGRLRYLSPRRPVLRNGVLRLLHRGSRRSPTRPSTRWRSWPPSIRRTPPTCRSWACSTGITSPSSSPSAARTPTTGASSPGSRQGTRSSTCTPRIRSAMSCRSRTGGSLRLFANVYNLFDTVYIQDATDASRWNGYHDDGDRHDADSAEVFLGYPRNLNVGFQIIF